MLRATANQLLPTTITGSLPRPSWYTENLGLKSFLQAMVETRFREQYEDALSVYLNEQLIAGLDIVTDGDVRFTQDIGGQSWTSYPPFHMAGFDGIPKMAPVGGGGIGFPRGHILHDYIEARLDAEHRRPRRSRHDAVRADVQGRAAPDHEAREVRHRDAGARGVCGAGLLLQGRARAHLGAFPTRSTRSSTPWPMPAARSSRWRSRRFTCWPPAGWSTRSSTPSSCSRCSTTPCGDLRAKTEVWCHTCWGNPSQQRMFAAGAELQAGAEDLEQGRCGRDHVRELQQPGHGSRSHRPRDHGHEGGDRRDRSPLAASRDAEGSGGSHPHGA